MTRYLGLWIGITANLIACDGPAKGNGKQYKNAAEYNNHIIDQQSRVMEDIGVFVRVSNTDLDSADQLLDTGSLELDEMVNNIRSMPLYKGDSMLRNTAISLFEFYRKLFREDYKQLVSYWREHGRQSPEGIAEANRVINRITLEEEKYDKNFHNAQKDFAEKYHMKLQDEKQ